MRLRDKTAIITGGAGNLGLATARRFQGEGARLVLVDRQGEALARAAAQLSGAGVLCLEADVTSAADMGQVAESAVETFGGIDIFFGNAGIEGVVSELTAYPPDTFDRVMEVNVKGLFTGLAAVLPKMRAGGSAVLTSSIAGLMGSPSNVAYATSKHAVVGLMRSAAASQGPRGIRVNAVHPGFVESEMLRRLIDQHEDPAGFEAALKARTKLGRFIGLDEIADGVLFLASDESRGITSHSLTIDGGVVQ